MATFQQHVSFWEEKASRLGERYVGRLGEDHTKQTKRIESLLMTRLKPGDFFHNGLDFACGWGRFLPFFSQYCSHMWAADIMPGVLEKAAKAAPNVSTIQTGYPLRLPWKTPRIDFLWAGMVLQHMVDEVMFIDACDELKRVLRSGARVIILDNGVDRAPHVTPRGPDRLATAFGLAPGWHAEKVTINTAPGDHWLLDGVKA